MGIYVLAAFQVILMEVVDTLKNTARGSVGGGCLGSLGSKWSGWCITRGGFLEQGLEGRADRVLEMAARRVI